MRADAEERRIPQHEVGELAHLDRTDLVVQTVSDRRTDGVLRHIPLRAGVVGGPVAGKGTSTFLHHMRGLPRSQYHFADATHRLRVRADHRDRAHVVQQVFGGDGRRPDAALGERKIFGHTGIEVMTDHQHVEVFVQRVHRVRPGRVGGARQHIRVRRDRDDVGCVPAARAFGVVRVDATPGDGSECLFDEPGLVQGVRVQRHLHPRLISDPQTRVDSCRCTAPVLVEFESRSAGA